MSRNLIVVAVAALAVGLGGGYWYARSSGPSPGQEAGKPAEREVLFYRDPMNPEITSPVPAKDSMGMDYVPVYAEEDTPGEREVLFYRHPMNPEVTSPVPAKDEMGMDYIPVYADDGGAGDEPAGTVKIDPVTEQNIGVRTAVAELRPLSHTVKTVGRLGYDESGMTRLHPKVEGWVEDLFVTETGQLVGRGDVLATIYSPELVSTQQEYLLALNNRERLAESPFPDVRKGADDMVRSALERLRLLDVPEQEIRELENTRQLRKTLQIRSPFGGIAARVGIREGQYVMPKDELYMLADLATIWVYVDVFEDEIPWVELGNAAEVRLRSLPGRTLEGTVTYIYPYLESRTRSVRARIELENPGLLLKPDMYADVTIHTRPQARAVVVPSEAILRPGIRPQVFVVRAPGKFEPREVELGVSSDGLTQLLSGVAAGESVVTSAHFLIDSESKLREATAKMLKAGRSGKVGAVAGHEGMDMSNSEMNDSGHEGMDMSDGETDHTGHEPKSGDDR